MSRSENHILPPSTQEARADLRSAIESLDRFAALNESSAIAPFASGKTDSSFQRVVEFARCFVTAMLSDEVRRDYQQRRDELQNEVLEAIAVVKSHHLILERLHEGDQTQQKLAETALKTIERYNQAIKKTTSWGGRFARFLFKHSGLTLDERLEGKTIDVPLPIFIQRLSPKLDSSKAVEHKIRTNIVGLASEAASRKISSIASPICSLPQPSMREVDAFRMKAITMIRKYGLESTSLDEAFQAIRQSPIQCTSDEAVEAPNIVTLRQTLEPFPGEILVLQGSFERDAYSRVPSVPIPASFRLMSRSAQSGFPYPSQYSGWALWEGLIPSYPNSLVNLPLFNLANLRKRQLALELLPQGTAIRKAKTLLNLKKEAWSTHASEYLGLHRQLIGTILAQAQCKDPQSIVETFFSWLAEQSDSYEKLSQAYQMVCRFYMTKPYERLVANGQLQLNEAWSQWRECLQQKVSTDVSSEPFTAFVRFIGAILGEAVASIALQFLSEKMGFCSPPLSPLSAALQTTLYRQMFTFFDEIDWELPESKEEQVEQMGERLFHSLQLDVVCLKKSPGDPTHLRAKAIVEELRDYYDTSSR